MSVTFQRAIQFVSVATVAAALAACGSKQESWPQPTAFNQKLTDAARPASSLPADVEKLECWAEQPLVHLDRVFCNVYFKGRATKDIGQQAIGWDIPVRLASRLDELSDRVPRYLDSYQFDLSLLASTGFLFVAKNDPQGLSIEVAADQNRVPLSQAEKFIVAVLPVVSNELSRRLTAASAAAPDSVRATWSSK